MLNPHHRLAALFMVAIFELEFVPQAEVYKTANYLRTLGITATVAEDKDVIIIEEKSYNEAMEKLTPIVVGLPDIYKFVWKNGLQETVLFEADRNEPFFSDAEITDSLKVLKNSDSSAKMTLVLRDDKATVIRYQNVVRKVENMGFRVTFAEGYMDAGWMSFPAIDIEIPNNIAGFKDAILRLSKVPEITRFLYNRGKNPNTNEYAVTFEEGTNFDLQISRLLANGIEVYKVDRILNKLFIHFPQTEAQNINKLEQVRNFDGLVRIKNIQENQSQYSKEEYQRNARTIWLDVPQEILKEQWTNQEFENALNDIVEREISKLKERGMVVLQYGTYAEGGGVQVPEISFTYKDEDSPKAEAIIKEYEDAKNALLTEISKASKPEGKPPKKPSKRGPRKSITGINVCISYFN